MLFSHRGGLNEAAVEGVLWVMVGYCEQKTNAKVKRSVRGFFLLCYRTNSLLLLSLTAKLQKALV